jgi:hypothetical protein
MGVFQSQVGKDARQHKPKAVTAITSSEKTEICFTLSITLIKPSKVRHIPTFIEECSKIWSMTLSFNSLSRVFSGKSLPQYGQRCAAGEYKC